MKSDNKYAIITDIHIKDNNHDLIRGCFEQLFLSFDELGVDYLIIAGDVFTTRFAQKLDNLLLFKEFLQNLRYKTKIKNVFSIPGNHDKTDQNSDKSYLQIFSDYPFFRVFPNYGYFFDDDVVFHLLPFFEEEEFLRQLCQIKRTEIEKYHVLVTHQAIDGVKNNDGTVVKNEIRPELFEGFDKVIVGHYHNESHINDKIWYIGSLVQQNFSENSEKGFVIFDSKECVFTKYNIGDLFPKFNKQVFTFEQIKESLVIAKQISESEEKFNNNRFEFILSEEEKGKFEKYKKQFAELGIDVKINNSEIKISEDLEEAQENTKMSVESIAKSFPEYCKEKGLNNKRLIEGIKILKQE